MTESYTRRLDELDSSQAPLAGGKGASLGELVHAGVRVPSAFVVTRPAFDRFVHAADPDGRVETVIADVGAGRTPVGDAAAQISELLADHPLPSDVAAEVSAAAMALGANRMSVRSSATCEDGASTAWAGQLDTFLNVAPNELADHIRSCWLSIFRPSALAYGAAHGYGAGQFGVAVVVQQMIDSEVSGIAFSVHPVTQEPDLRLIEACFGQGEAIVSGAIDPDQYVVDRGAERIVEQHVGTQTRGLFINGATAELEWRELGDRGAHAKLDETQILEYAAALDRIEAHYGFPVDTEWAWADGSFWVLQSRPITTLAPEYRERIIDDNIPWFASVHRPMPLLEWSIMTEWLGTKHAGDDIGFHVDHQLAIEDDRHLTTVAISADELQAAHQHVRDLEQNDRTVLVDLLTTALHVFDQAQQRVDDGATFVDLNEAIEFLIEVGKMSTAYPRWVLLALDAGHLTDPEVQELAERLRARSLYPKIASELIDPMVREHGRALGVSDPDRMADISTWHELRNDELDRETLEHRLQQVNEGKLFVAESINGELSLRFVAQTGYLLMRLQGQRFIAAPDDPDNITGHAAWPGSHRGRARLVLTSDPTEQAIDDGDVVISVQSNPNLMPLLRHAGAIVTDQGGVACHAAIIARELKIPTLIGTDRATSTIKDGDIVEVDATQQVVHIVEHASEQPG